jgi:hypothetical protein
MKISKCLGSIVDDLTGKGGVQVTNLNPQGGVLFVAIVKIRLAP